MVQLLYRMESKLATECTFISHLYTTRMDYVACSETPHDDTSTKSQMNSICIMTNQLQVQ